MGFDKLAAQLAGLPVLLRTVQAFLACPAISQVIVVTSPDRQSLLEEHGVGERCLFIPGGAERHHSVWQGLLACTEPLVAVHDGARPFVTSQLITATLAAAALHGAAAAGRRITDTLKRVDSAGKVTDSVEREGLWGMETPQCFQTPLLRAAYRHVLDHGLLVTDEVSALQYLKHPVHMVEATTPNPKITYPPDFALGEQLLK
jgi:2-C-methyl-D-erythritol 4-phosphate cytidylyltransferase